MIEIIRQGTLLITCTRCGCRCLAGRSEKGFTRYYCTNQDCRTSQKIARPKAEAKDAR